MPRRLRVLIVTNLFPSNVDPGFAPFNRQQFAALGQIADVEVFAVVPRRLAPRLSRSGVVAHEVIDGLDVYHPRFVTAPGLPSLNVVSLVASLLPRLKPRRHEFDVVLASYAYPDGCAGVLLGAALGLPVVVKCHGSDLNRVPGDLLARLQLRTLLPRAQAVVCVSERLRVPARELGVSDAKLHVVYNGVDRRRFPVMERVEARRKLGLPEDSELVVYVGHLAEHKGTLDLLAAIPKLAQLRPNVTTAFVGDGPLSREVTQLAEHGNPSQGTAMAVGRVRHDEVPQWMAAADVLCLPSWDEGMPNVVREAHAVGRPVVATQVGGIPEAVHRPELGRLVPPRDPEALARALAEQLATARALPPAELSRLATVPSWEESAASLLAVLVHAADRR
jgi:teichuronic acid biosynthesis glycosyltransferase TuaC